VSHSTEGFAGKMNPVEESAGTIQTESFSGTEGGKISQTESSAGAKNDAKNHAVESLADATTQTKDSGGGTKTEA
jgi:hypothetical protein